MKLILENWRLFTESHTKEQEEELKTIVGELEKASEMHANQAKRIQQMIDETDDDKLKEVDDKNCGCGQDPCKTYGVQVKIGEVHAGDKAPGEVEKRSKRSMKNDALVEDEDDETVEEGGNFFDNMRAKQKRCKGKPKTGDCAEDRPTKKAWKKITKEEQDLYDIIDEEIEAVLAEKKKKPCKKAKGKRYVKRVNGRCRSYGQSGKAKDGGDRIRPGTKKGDAYCARSAKIKKCKNPPCANDLSRKKWKCRGSKSMKE
jgi:hypothetical protein